MTSIEAALFFLTTDRCLILNFAMRYQKKQQTLHTRTMIASMLAISLTNVYLFTYSFPKEAATSRGVERTAFSLVRHGLTLN